MTRRAALWVVAGALALGVVSGCSGSATRSVPSSTRVRPTGAGACATEPRGSVTLTPAIDGHLRTVIVHVPPVYDAAARAPSTPLVLNLHGSGATASDQAAFSGMDAASDADDFIVGYPQALIPDGGGYDWNVPGQPLVGGRAVPAGAADDVRFLEQLVGLLSRDYCVDATRVDVTGFSGGARMASQMACDASGVVAAVAPVSGLRRPVPCPAERAVPVISFHGTADPVDPYGGQGAAYWTYSVPDAARQWAQQNGCAPAPTTSPVGAGATLTTYGSCRAGAVVELYTLAGEGHEWPGGPPVRRALSAVFGPQSNAVDANATMWAFFAGHPM